MNMILCDHYQTTYNLYKKMSCLPDAFKINNPLRGTSSSKLGVVATFVLFGLLLWLYLPQTIYTLSGKYYQYQYWVQQPTYDHIEVPRQFRTAIVFYNKTSNSVANHTLLKTYATFSTFVTNNLGLTNRDGVMSCDPLYFSDTINPTTLKDCFIFPKDTYIDLSFYQGVHTTFGFDSFFTCSNPFNCSFGNPYYTTKTNNFTTLFSNFSFTLYFTSRILTHDAGFKDQLFSISSHNWNTPFTTTTHILTELTSCNVTVDDSIKPWKILKNISFSTWSGVVKGIPLSTTNSLLTPPQAAFISGIYQKIIHRYYEKVDKLLAMIFGGIFILYVIMYLPINYINRCFARIDNAQELLIQHYYEEENNQSRYSSIAVKVNTKDFWKRRLPCYQQNVHIKQLQKHQDLARIIKLIEVTEKNVKKVKIPLLQCQKVQYNIDDNLKERNKSSNKQYQQNILNESKQDINEGQNIPQGSKRHLPQNQIYQNDLTQQEMQQINKYNMQTKTFKAVKQSGNAVNLFGNNPQVQQIKNNKQQYKILIQNYQFANHCKPKNSSLCTSVLHFFHSSFKLLDFFPVKNGFDLSPGNSSICSSLCSIFMILILGLLISTTVANLNQHQVMISTFFQQPQDINYNIQTGELFRPFYCFSNSAAVSKITSVSPTIQFTFFNRNSSGTFNLKTKNLLPNNHSYLGITPDSPDATLKTQYCFIMQDGQNIQMGGLGTPQQAYLGIMTSAYCSGNTSYCQSISSTLTTTILTFIQNQPSYLYLPINHYNQYTKNVTSTGFYLQQFRKGSSSFRSTSAVQQTLYVDQMRLLDRYSMDFINKKQKILNQTLTSDRYQYDAIVQGINASIPYHEVRIRPSGKVLDNILRGHTLDIFFAIIGGITFMLWSIFKCFIKPYNNVILRLWLGEKVYGFYYHTDSTFFQCLWTAYTFLPLCCLSKRFKQNVQILRLLDEKYQKDMDFNQIIKDINTMSQLSTAEYESLPQKQNALIYFKKKYYPKKSKINKQNINNEIKIQQNRNPQQDSSQFVSVGESSQSGKSSSFEDKIIPINQSLDQTQKQKQKEKKKQQLFDKHRSPKGLHAQKTTCKNYLDIFSSQPQLSLNGQWTVSSCYGGLVTLVIIACILMMFYYSLNLFDKNRHQTISYNQGVTTNPENQPPLILNSNNFRLAVGFYIKPNASFLNVSNYINSNSNVTIDLTQITLQRDPNNQNQVSQTSSSKVSLIPCSSTYFDGFKDANTDYSFIAGLPNAFCLPTNLSFQLSSISQDTMKYATIQIYDTVSNSSAQIKTLLSSYVVGLYMTVPIVDLKTKSFKNSVKQIRGHYDSINSLFHYNLTLSKQQIIFSSGNYSISSTDQIQSTYNYLNHYQSSMKYSQFSFTSSTYTITLSYNSIVDQYHIRQKHFAEIFGLTGALIAFFYFFGLVIVQPFNLFKKRYIVGKSLAFEYNIIKNTKKKVKQRQRSSTSRLQIQYFCQQACELLLFLTWLWYIINTYLCCCCSFLNCSKTKKMKRILYLHESGSQHLNFYTFFKKYADLKLTLNSYYHLSSNFEVKPVSIFTKLPYLRNSPDNIYHDKERRSQFNSYIEANQLTSYEKRCVLELENPNPQIGFVELYRLEGHQKLANILKQQMVESMNNNNDNFQQIYQLPNVNNSGKMIKQKSEQQYIPKEQIKIQKQYQPEPQKLRQSHDKLIKQEIIQNSNPHDISRDPPDLRAINTIFDFNLERQAQRLQQAAQQAANDINESDSPSEDD